MSRSLYLTDDEIALADRVVELVTRARAGELDEDVRVAVGESYVHISANGRYHADHGVGEDSSAAWAVLNSARLRLIDARRRAEARATADLDDELAGITRDEIDERIGGAR